MKLLIDIGNSRVKWGVESAGEIEGPYAFAAEADAITEAFELAWGGLSPASVCFCSVSTGNLPEVLSDWSRGAWDVEPVRVRPAASAGPLVCGYQDPDALGADRWANLLGARDLLGATDVVVVDAGTAVTVDALRADGRHLGGAILPGLRAARAGLHAAAPALPAAGGVAGLPAKTTAEGMAAGSLVGLAGAIERVAREVGNPLEGPAWLLTGGDTDTLRPWLDPGWRHEPLLTLRGLSAALEN
ncbi:MAG: type III pantothenate kinase [Halofilum sp. (in: g-proteobacteria)]|nr:type III pantothenate kinase [Halofilum sp. (in: g-proteobacteria)]